MKEKTTQEKNLNLISFVLVALAGSGCAIVHNVLHPKLLITGRGKKKIICVGDSLTYSQGVIGSRKINSYPAILAKLLGDEYQVWNYGLSNRTLLSSGDMSYGKETFAKKSLHEDASIVLIMLGSNDSKPRNWNRKQFEEEYIAFIKKYQSLKSVPKVYVMLPTRVFRKSQKDKVCNDRILTEEVIPVITYAAEQTGVELIDLYSLTKDHPEWYVDRLHPNAEGNRAIAEKIYRHIIAV